MNSSSTSLPGGLTPGILLLLLVREQPFPSFSSLCFSPSLTRVGRGGGVGSFVLLNLDDDWVLFPSLLP